MTPKPDKKIDNFFLKARDAFILWVKENRSGNWSIHFNVNEGGIRGKPKIETKNEL